MGDTVPDTLRVALDESVGEGLFVKEDVGLSVRHSVKELVGVGDVVPVWEGLLVEDEV